MSACIFFDMDMNRLRNQEASPEQIARQEKRKQEKIAFLGKKRLLKTFAHCRMIPYIQKYDDTKMTYWKFESPDHYEDYVFTGSEREAWLYSRLQFWNLSIPIEISMTEYDDLIRQEKNAENVQSSMQLFFRWSTEEDYAVFADEINGNFIMDTIWLGELSSMIETFYIKNSSTNIDDIPVRQADEEWNIRNNKVDKFVPYICTGNNCPTIYPILDKPWF